MIPCTVYFISFPVDCSSCCWELLWRAINSGFTFFAYGFLKLAFSWWNLENLYYYPNPENFQNFRFCKIHRLISYCYPFWKWDDYCLINFIESTISGTYWKWNVPMSSIEILFHPSIRCWVLNFSTIFDVSFFKSLKDNHEKSWLMHENLFQKIFLFPSNIDSESVSLPHLVFRLIGHCLGIIIGFLMFFS